MPADLNRVTLVGRLTRDPELRHLPSGDPLASMRVAVNSRHRDESGNWGDKANFFDVTVFGRQADTVTQYMSKGRRIGVDGRLSWREWQAQDGTKRQSVEVIANDVFFLDSRRDGEDGGSVPAAPGWGESPQAAPEPDLVPQPVPAAANGGADDEVPF